MGVTEPETFVKKNEGKVMLSRLASRSSIFLEWRTRFYEWPLPPTTRMMSPTQQNEDHRLGDDD